MTVVAINCKNKINKLLEELSGSGVRGGKGMVDILGWDPASELPYFVFLPPDYGIYSHLCLYDICPSLILAFWPTLNIITKSLKVFG